MDARKPITRRRKWKRFKIKGGAIVLLHKARLLDIGKPKLIELGPVIDISMGGLAVQFVESKNRLHESETISISIPSIGVTLPDLQCKVIFEKVLTTLPDGKKIYNRSVEFVNLTKIQNLQLESFIRKHTFHTIPDRRPCNPSVAIPVQLQCLIQTFPCQQALPCRFQCVFKDARKAVGYY